jgi:hypothetical protein
MAWEHGDASCFRKHKGIFKLEGAYAESLIIAEPIMQLPARRGLLHDQGPRTATLTA